MQLPFFLKKPPSNKFLGILLKEDQGIVMIIERKKGEGNIIDHEKFNYSNGWEHLVKDIDQTLFKLETKHKIHLEETIFFIFSHLIDTTTNQIKKPYQNTVKNLAKNLDLKPLGFIDCREAVVKAIEQKEEIRLTGILIELDKNDVNIFIYKVGQLVFTKLVSRTDNLIDDISPVFEQLKGNVMLPTKIIMYNSKDLDQEVSRILSYRWPTDLFVQLPKVEIVQEKDILTNLVLIFNQQIKQDDEKQISAPSSVTKTGFVIGEDIKEREPEPNQKIEEKKDNFNFSKINQSIKEFFLKFKSLTFFKNDQAKKILLPIGLLIICLSIFAHEFFLHKTKLEIYLPSRNIEKQLTVDTLKISPLEKTFELSNSQPVTGKKDVGESARGEVTIYNFSKETTFGKGAKIHNSGLEFLFNEEIKVASASLTSDGSAKLPGKAKVKVTAAQIGIDSNLTKGQNFKIEDLDSDIYFAKNEADFSGGSKKQIATVSKEDLDNLEIALLKKAKSQQLSVIKLDSDKKSIDQLTTTEIIQTSYSKEIGEEANQITLTAKVKTTLFVYNKADLTNIINPLLKKNIAEDYSLDSKNITFQIDKVEEKKRKNYITISVKGKAIKIIDKNKAINVLLGKNISDIDSILSSTFSSTGYNLSFNKSMPIPILKQRLPFFPKNFEVKFDSL